MHRISAVSRFLVIAGAGASWCAFGATTPAHAQPAVDGFGAVQPVQGDAAAPERRRYDDYKIVAVTVRTQRELRAAMTLGEMLNCRPSAHMPLQLLIHRDEVDALSEADLDFRVLSDNAQELIDLEDQWRRESREQAQAMAGGPDLDVPGGDGIEPFFADYRGPDEINQFITTLANNNPDLATRITVGESLEGRPVYAIRITSDPTDTDRPVLVVKGCQHAREWISPASVTWTIQHLVNNYGSDEEITRLVDTVEWHLIPVINPDGYQYSIDVDRFWRKNRRDNPFGGDGVDLNRNWGFQWGLSSGSSGNPSSPIYRGPAPFSEPETTIVAEYICALNGGNGLGDCPPGRVLGTIDVHAYGQVLLGAWAYSETILPPRDTELRIIQEDMEEAMTSQFGVPYIAGLGVDQLLYEASGTGPDWSLGAVDATSWTYELRPDSPNPGWLLPPSEIVPTAMETFAGLSVHATYLLERIVFRVQNPPMQVQFDAPPPIAIDAVPFNRAVVDQPTLSFNYRVAGSSGTFQSVALTPTSDPERFQVTPTALLCGNEYEYFLEGTTLAGELVRSPDPSGPEPLPTFMALNIAPPFSGNPGTILPCPEVEPCPGDANGDGVVDTDDLGILLGAFGGTTEPGTPPDFNGDGVLDTADLGILLGNFGGDC